MTLGDPVRIVGDMRITFEGEGSTRFRVQHTGDYRGAPDDLCWADVSRLNDQSLEPEEVISDGYVLPLVDRVEGNAEVVYRRYVKRDGDMAMAKPAEWLRVLAGDEYDAEGVRRCQTYSITLVPAA